MALLPALVDDRRPWMAPLDQCGSNLGKTDARALFNGSQAVVSQSSQADTLKADSSKTARFFSSDGSAADVQPDMNLHITESVQRHSSKAETESDAGSEKTPLQLAKETPQTLALSVSQQSGTSVTLSTLMASLCKSRYGICIP